MSRLMDADALEREGWSLCRTYQKDKDTMVYEVKKPSDFPTINTAELIRCEDCKYSDWYETKSGEQLAFCTYHDVGGFKPDSYCSFAESADMRKGEGEKE